MTTQHTTAMVVTKQIQKQEWKRDDKQAKTELLRPFTTGGN